MKIDNYYISKGIFPEDVKNEYENKIFRFAHVDVDVYESAKDIVTFVWPRIISGGVMIFDDYGAMTTSGITDLINELKEYLADGIFMANMNGHGIFIKK